MPFCFEESDMFQWLYRLPLCLLYMFFLMVQLTGSINISQISTSSFQSLNPWLFLACSLPLHPWKLTWNLKITQLIFQTLPLFWVPAVNFPGCKSKFLVFPFNPPPQQKNDTEVAGAAAQSWESLVGKNPGECGLHWPQGWVFVGSSGVLGVLNNWLVFFYVHPYLEKWSNLTNIFQMGWNHQPDKESLENVCVCGKWLWDSRGSISTEPWFGDVVYYVNNHLFLDGNISEYIDLSIEFMHQSNLGRDHVYTYSLWRLTKP